MTFILMTSPEVWRDYLTQVSKAERTLSTEKKHKKIVGLMEDKFGGKIMTKFAELRAKLFLYEQLDMEKPEHRHCKGMKKITDVVEKTL